MSDSSPTALVIRPMRRLFARLIRLRGLPVGVRYAVTAGFVLATAAAGRLIPMPLGGGAYVLFFPAIILTGITFDRGSGVFATLLSALLVELLFVGTRDGLVPDVAEAVPLVLFVVTGILTAVMIESLHTAFAEVTRTHADLIAAYERLAASEREKDALLRELSHRIKNDLQTVASLLGLQRLSLKDRAAREVLTAAIERIAIMGRVHGRLTRRGGEAVVDMRDFIGELCLDLRAAHTAGRPVDLRAEAESQVLDLDRALPVGLILNELVTNALKHAFPDGRAGRIDVRFAAAADGLELTVADDGVGVGKDREDGVGLKLVRVFAGQLGARLARDATGTGTVWRLRFAADPADGAEDEDDDREGAR